MFTYIWFIFLFNQSKNNACPRAEDKIFSRTFLGFEAKGLSFVTIDFNKCSQTSSRTPPLMSISKSITYLLECAERRCSSRGHILKSLAWPRSLQAEVESSRTPLALRTSSRTHFEVLGLGLEASSPWPWPRSLRSSKIALSSARGQHYFLNS